MANKKKVIDLTDKIKQTAAKSALQETKKSEPASTKTSNVKVTRISKPSGNTNSAAAAGNKSTTPGKTGLVSATRISNTKPGMNTNNLAAVAGNKSTSPAKTGLVKVTRIKGSGNTAKGNSQTSSGGWRKQYYGLGNIDLNNRKVYTQPDGSISTVNSINFYDEDEKKEILIPTIVNGKQVSDDEAIDHYYKTGEYLGKFDTSDDAEKYARQLHVDQEKLYGNQAGNTGKQAGNSWDKFVSAFRNATNNAGTFLTDLKKSGETNPNAAKRNAMNPAEAGRLDKGVYGTRQDYGTRKQNGTGGSWAGFLRGENPEIWQSALPGAARENSNVWLQNVNSHIYDDGSVIGVWSRDRHRQAIGDIDKEIGRMQGLGKRNDEIRAGIDQEANRRLEGNLHKMFGENLDEPIYIYDQYKDRIGFLGSRRPPDYGRNYEKDALYDAALYDAMKGREGAYAEDWEKDSDKTSAEVEAYWDLLEHSESADEAYKKLRGYSPAEEQRIMVGSANENIQHSIEALENQKAEHQEYIEGQDRYFNQLGEYQAWAGQNPNDTSYHADRDLYGTDTGDGYQNVHAIASFLNGGKAYKQQEDTDLWNDVGGKGAQIYNVYDNAYYTPPEVIDALNAYYNAGDYERFMGLWEGTSWIRHNAAKRQKENSWQLMADELPITGTVVGALGKYGGSLLGPIKSGLDLIGVDPNSTDSLMDPTRMGNYVQGKVGENVKSEVTKATGSEFLGDLGKTVYGAGTSILDFTLQAGTAKLFTAAAGIQDIKKAAEVTKRISLGLMSMGAYTSDYAQTMDETKDPVYSSIHAGLNAMLELSTETWLSADNLFSTDTYGFEFFKNAVLGEAAEEATGAVLDPFVETGLNKFYYGYIAPGKGSTDSKWHQDAMQLYMSDPKKYTNNDGTMDWGACLKDAMGQYGMQILESTFAGGLAAVPSAAFAGAITQGDYKRTGKQVVANNQVEQLATIAQGVNGVPELQALGKQILEDYKSGKKINNKAIGRLFSETYKATEGQVNAITRDVLQKNVQADMEKVYGGRVDADTIKRIAGTATDAVLNGTESLKKDGRALLDKYAAAKELVSDMTGGETVDPMKRTAGLMESTREEILRETKAKNDTLYDLDSMIETKLKNKTADIAKTAVKGASAKMAGAEQMEAAGISQEEQTTAADGRQLTDEEKERNRSRKRAIAIYDAEDGSTASGEIVRKEGKNYVLKKADGTEVTMDQADVKAADEVTAAVMNYLSVENVDNRTATDLIEVARGKGVTIDNVEGLLNGYQDMLIRGYTSANIPTRINFNLDAAQELYRRGQQLAKTTEAERRAGAESRGSILNPGKSTVEYKGVDVKQLSGQKRKQVQAAETIAKAVGYNLTFVNDTEDTGTFGRFDSATNSVVLNVAGMDRNGQGHHLLVAMGHEMTHLLEKNSPEAYTELRKFIFEEMARNGMDVSTRIAQKMNSYNRSIARMQEAEAKAREQGTTTEGEDRITRAIDFVDIGQATAEVVADACDQVLSNEKLIRQMAEEHPSLYTKVRDFVADFIGKVKGALQGMRESGSIDSRYILDVDELAKRFGLSLQEVQRKTSEGENTIAEGSINDSRYSFIGEDPMTGMPVYLSNFAEGTSKVNRGNRIVNLIQNIFSKAPISLTVYENGTKRNFEAQFDPDYDPSGARKTDAGKMAFGLRRGTKSEIRVALNLADDYAQILEESTYTGSEGEKPGKNHPGVTQWHYFVDDIYYVPQGSNIAEPYEITVNIKETAKGNYVYSYSAEKIADLDTKKLSELGIRPVNNAGNTAQSSLNSGYMIAETEKDDNIKSGQTKKSSFSLAEMDDAYLNAVEAGDHGKAQELVDQAARAAGYTMKVYHGTPTGGFTQFRDWSYFTENREYADRYQNASASSIRGRYKTTKQQTYELYMNPGRVFDTRKAKEKRLFNRARMEYGLTELENTNTGLPDWTDGRDLIDYIEENDLPYDTIILDEGGDLIDGKPVSRGISYVTRSNLVKSAEAVTRDDQGNVIPLSERFDRENNDIRFSMAEEGQEKIEGSARVPVVDDIDKAGIKKGIPSTENSITEYMREVNTDEEYRSAVEHGDIEKATAMLMNKLKNTEGIIPFKAPHWDAGESRTIARLIKSGTPEAVAEAAADMARLVPDNAVLIPMPDHTGKVTNNTDTMILARAIGEITGRPVMAALEGANRESRFAAKAEGRRGASQEELGFKKILEIPDGTMPYFVDNMVGKGITADAARQAFGGGITLAYTKSIRSSGIAGLKNAVITYDPNGNLIPLSQRFDRSKRNVSFSMSEMDEIQEKQKELQDARKRIKEIESSEEMQAAIDKAMKEGIFDDYNEFLTRTKLADLKRKAQRLDEEIEKWRKDYQENLNQQNLEKERQSIEKSGLTEPEYRNKRAVKHFGTTTNPMEAGYIIRNGSMLNFSGEKGKHYGYRGSDHREIGIIYEDGNIQGSAAMITFMNDGNVRVMPESTGIDLSGKAEPTAEQYRAIRRLVNEWSREGEFAIDYSNENGDNIDSVVYEGRISADRVIADIKHFYKTGEVRQPSELSRFYSLSEDTPDAMDWIMGIDASDMTNDELSFFNTKMTRKLIRDYQKLAGQAKETQAKITQMKEALKDAKGDEARKLRINIETETNKQNRIQDQMTDISGREDFGKMLTRAQSTIDTFLRGKTQREVDISVRKMKTEADQMRKSAREAAEALESLANREGAVIARRMFSGDALEKAARGLQENFHGRGDREIIMDRMGAIGLKMMTGDGAGMMQDVSELVDYMLNADWATYRFGMFGGQRFEASQIDGDLRDIMTEDVIEKVSALLPEAAQHSGGNETEIQSLIRYINQITGMTRQAARGMQRMEQLAENMQAQGDRLRQAAGEMRSDLTQAIRYFDTVNERNRAQATAEQIEQVTRALESKAAQRVLEEQNKWAQRLENDRNLRRLTEESRALRRKINTAYTRVQKLILDETDLKNIPEYMKPAARAAVRLILQNDAEGGRKLTGHDWQQLQRSMTTLRAIDARDGTAIDFEEIENMIGDADVADVIRESLEKIETGIQFWSSGNRGRTGVNMEGDKAALTKIQEGMTQIYDIVSKSRQIWLDGKNVDAANAAYEVDTEARKREAYREWTGTLGKAISGANRTIVLGNMTPEYFFKNLKNNGLARIYNEFKRGEDQYGRILRRAKGQIETIAEETGYSGWDTKAKHAIQLESGESVNLTLEQMMSLYATWKRERTLGPEMSDHLGQGGFVFEEEAEKKILGREAKQQRPHRVNEADMKAIEDALTSEQKDYVNRMVGILSSDMAKIGNEASLRMYGIEKYKETYYFPFAVWDGVKNKSSNAGSQVNPTNNNRAAHQSFTNRRKSGANNAVMLRDFSTVCAEHINQMATYATMGQAIENLNRVLNFRVVEGANDPTTATERNVESILTERYGKDAVGYLRKFMQDLNGGTVQETLGFGQRLMSIFKKNAVGGSLSVALQQPLSYIRASTMIDMKYLIAAGAATDSRMPGAAAGGLAKGITGKENGLSKYWTNSYNEMLEHSGVAVIKDMGKFDVNFSRGAVDWLHPDTTEKGLRRVYSKVEDVTNALPEKMDQYTWIKMWNAIKLEQHAQHPEMDMKSDEFLDMVGERFNDVMRKTQVYDSVLVKSQLMRNQDWLSKSITAFRAEPTLSLNLFMDALSNFRDKGGKKNMAAVLSTFLLSAIAQAAVKGIMGAGRNPDEKKTLAENFAYRFGSSFISEANPLSLIPGFDNIVDALSGNDINDNAWGMIKTFSKTLTNAFNPPTGENLNGMSAFRYVEDSIGQLTQMFTGIPAKNLMRDSRAVYNWFMAPYAKRDSSGNVIRYQMIDQFTSSDIMNAIQTMTGMEIWDSKPAGYYQRIYETEKRGDEEAARGMREYVALGLGKDEKTIAGGIASAAKKDEDASAAETADWLLDQGYMSGTSWITSQFKEGKISEEEMRKLYAEHFPDKNPNTSLWNYWQNEWKEGNISEAEAKKNYLKYNPKRTEKDWKSLLWGNHADDYKDGKITEAEARKLYKQYHPDATENETYWAMDKLNYQKKTGSAEDYSMYNRFDKAIEDRNLKAVREATRELIKYSTSKDPKETMKRSVTSYVKPLYLAAKAGSQDEVSLINLANATLEEAGYTKAERDKYFKGWQKDKKKGKTK